MNGLPPPVMLSVHSRDSISLGDYPHAGATASVAYITVNKAFYYPFRIRYPAVARKFWWFNGTTVGTDSVQVGIYANSYRSVVLGTATVTSGASVIQTDDIADTLLEPGAYFLAITCNGTTTHLFRASGGNGMFGRQSGVLAQTSAYPLPATMAPTADAGATYAPIFGVAFRTLVN